MVSFSHTSPSMFFRKLTFSDQPLSSTRRKVFSPFGLGIVLSFFVLSAVLFNISSKGSFNPVFKGLSGSGNSSLRSWSFSGAFSYSHNNASVLSGCNDTNGSVQTSANGTIVASDSKSSDLASSGRKDEMLESAHVGNMSEKLTDGRLESVGAEKNASQPLKTDVLLNESGKGFEMGIAHFGDSALNETNRSSSQTDGSFDNSLDNRDFAGARKKETGPVELNKLPYEECDIFHGRWVKDDTLPYYPPGSCPYIDKDFDCHLNGRPDSEYVKWKWQPYDCDIPRFNATDFLKRLSGQKLVFVGDSLNRNMWESLVCVLRHGVEDKSRVYEISGRHEFKKKGFYAFRFEDYNCTVDFVSSPFLVKESYFKGKNGTLETLKLDTMDQTTSMYCDADVIIFNTGHWWTHEKTSRGEDYYQEGNYVHPRLKVLAAYKRALLTWARWVDHNIDAEKTRVIFRGYSVTHFRGGPWNSGGQCSNETEPIFKEAHLAKYPSKMKIFEHILKEMKTPVTYLNISRLTDYRKDAHPSIFRPNYQQQEIHAQDCSHWCLPGVPDTWNELLYASLLKSRRGSWKH